jgi:predicted SAM-dependent methyltransferase
VKLNLGCNDRSVSGYVGVDVCPPADLIADLTQPWPWGDSTVDEVLAFDVFEHLPNKRQTMNELWRVMKPNGIARIQVPHATEGDGGHCDPTHASWWTTSDFEYYHPGIAERERFRHSAYYGIKADFTVLEMKKTRYQRNWGGFVVEIQAVIQAVK